MDRIKRIAAVAISLLFLITGAGLVVSAEGAVPAGSSPEGFTFCDMDVAPESVGPLKLDYIRGRGNSTWYGSKRPYKIKLDKKTDIFGMGKNKHWVLLANVSGQQPEIEDIEIPEEIVMKTGEHVHLDTLIIPNTARWRYIWFSVDDFDVVEADMNGVLTGKTPGTTQVTVVVEYGDADETRSIVKHCSVTVVGEDTDQPAEPEENGLCSLCGRDHSGSFLQRVIGFFHRILYFFARVFGLR